MLCGCVAHDKNPRTVVEVHIRFNVGSTGLLFHCSCTQVCLALVFRLMIFSFLQLEGKKRRRGSEPDEAVGINGHSAADDAATASSATAEDDVGKSAAKKGKVEAEDGRPAVDATCRKLLGKAAIGILKKVGAWSVALRALITPVRLMLRASLRCDFSVPCTLERWKPGFEGVVVLTVSGGVRSLRRTTRPAQYCVPFSQKIINPTQPQPTTDTHPTNNQTNLFIILFFFMFIHNKGRISQIFIFYYIVAFGLRSTCWTSLLFSATCSGAVQHSHVWSVMQKKISACLPSVDAIHGAHDERAKL